MSRAPMFQRATVTRVIKETADARTFVLAPEDGPLTYRAGQYCTFRVEVDGETLYRSYSMSSSPDTDDELCTTVKRVPGGKVSNWLHDRAQVGDTLHALAPCGDFVLHAQAPADRPLVLVTGGVGITPAMSMLEATAASGRPIHFIHAARDGGWHAFGERVKALAAQHPNVQPFFVYESPRLQDRPDAVGRVNGALLSELLPADRDVDLYFLGPKPFMQTVHAAGLAAGVAPERLRWEFFGPLESLQAA